MYFIKNNIKKLIISSAIILFPIIVGWILWNKLPQRIPIHWNLEGAADGYGSKTFAVFGIPAFLLFVHWLCAFGTCFDKKNKDQHQKAINIVFWICPVVSLYVSTMVYLFSFGFNISIPSLSFSLLGITFIIIGNLLPKIKPNRTLGIKLPWTLKSEENWNRTHRLAGWVWVFGGIAIVLSGLLELFWGMIAVLVVMLLVPVIYSIVLYMNGI